MDSSHNKLSLQNQSSGGNRASTKTETFCGGRLLAVGARWVMVTGASLMDVAGIRWLTGAGWLALILAGAG